MEEGGDRVQGGGGGQFGTQHPDYQSGAGGQAFEQQQQQQQQRRSPGEEVVQVVYQSDQHGSLVGVESTSLLGSYSGGELAASGGSGGGIGAQQPSMAYIDGAGLAQATSGAPALAGSSAASGPLDGSVVGPQIGIIGGVHQQLSRAASTLPSVAEESTSSGQNGAAEANGAPPGFLLDELAAVEGVAPPLSLAGPTDEPYQAFSPNDELGQLASANQFAPAPQQPIYSTINKQPQQQPGVQEQSTFYPQLPPPPPPQQQQQLDQSSGELVYANQEETFGEQLSDYKENLGENLINYETSSSPPPPPPNAQESNANELDRREDESTIQINDEISQIIARQKAGAAERGSFRHNFRKKLGLSVSTNENDLTTYRQKFIEQVQVEEAAIDKQSAAVTTIDELSSTIVGNQPSVATIPAPSNSQKFKRTHSVSFNVNGSRGNRHSVDIRNLPSYLTHKRTSIVDVAKGAMSSLISSFGGGGGGGSSSASVISRRDSMLMSYDDYGANADEDNEPIFEEPIAPTLSLGQRVAMVRNSGTEFGTVGWIGQLPDIDDDWIVGVIFDNMIGDCDGAYKGTRYFYARDSYAMFVPLSVLTKTDNYIGRPETGTVLSRMSVSLKPGQLISIQRSSIRLQHCFLNAPHQRVGHDVRAVSNRLHCQCHNCGPCAHLTQQGRPHNVLPHFGAHHLPIKKKNSLAHAAVEMLAHHHHHFHEEEEHEEKDYEFGDNAAHACNFVRYSCCQQSGQPGHEFSTDCGMVRPELLDNLIHAPKAPHRRSRPKRRHQQQQKRLKGGDNQTYGRGRKPLPGDTGGADQLGTLTNTLETNQSTLSGNTHTMTTTKSYETPGSEITAYGGDDDEAHLADGRANGGANDADEDDDDDEDELLSGGRRRRRRRHGDHNDGGGRGSQSSYSASASSSSSSLSRSGDGNSMSGSSDDSSRSNSPGGGGHNNRGGGFNGPPQEPYNYYQYDTSSFRPQNNVYKTVESQVNIVDQQRYVYRRDSSAFVQSPMPSNWSDDQDSNLTTSGLGTRLLRCLGCLKRRPRDARRPRRRKLSFRDKVLEYRRRQSTFVPSTLAKPHEDFASHGIVLNPQGHQPHQQAPASGGGGGGEPNSDYSSCSRSSHSSRSSSPPYSPRRGPDGGGGGARELVAAAEMAHPNLAYQQQQQQQQQTTTMVLEHGAPNPNDALKSPCQWGSYMVAEAEAEYRRQLNYGDYNFSDNYSASGAADGGYKEARELSKDSALTDLAHSDTYKTNSSSDTLKYLIDQSINEQVTPLQPIQQLGMSPISSSSLGDTGAGAHQFGDAHRAMPADCANGSTIGSDQVDISSPTASAIDNDEAGDGDGDAADGLVAANEEVRVDMENLHLDDSSWAASHDSNAQEPRRDFH